MTRVKCSNIVIYGLPFGTVPVIDDVRINCSLLRPMKHWYVISDVFFIVYRAKEQTGRLMVR